MLPIFFSSALGADFDAAPRGLTDAEPVLLHSLFGWLTEGQRSATRAALRYAKELWDTFIPGTAAWNDSNNNRWYTVRAITRVVFSTRS